MFLLLPSLLSLPSMPPLQRLWGGFVVSLLLLFGLVAYAQTLPVEPVHTTQSHAVSAPVTVPLRAGVDEAHADYFHLQKKIARWSDNTRLVLVYISTATFLPDWHPQNEQIVRDAFAEWQNAMDNRVRFVFMNDASQADVIVSWWNNAQPGVDAGACGLNRMMTWGKYIAQNDIYLSLHDFSGAPWPPNELYSTALHEIGHMMGIQEHSDSPRDIMAPSSAGLQHLSARDIATMKRVYAAKPHYTNPPGYHLARFEDFKKTQKGKRIWIPLILPIPL